VQVHATGHDVSGQPGTLDHNYFFGAVGDGDVGLARARTRPSARDMLVNDQPVGPFFFPKELSIGNPDRLGSGFFDQGTVSRVLSPGEVSPLRTCPPA